MSPAELDWIESDTKGDRDIAGIFFNFPLFLLGLADSTYSNQEEARYALYTEIDFPILDMYQDSLNMWLTPRYGGYLGYDQEDVEAIQHRLQEAKAQASERASAEFTASTTTFLEAREIQGRPKLAVKDFVIINQIPVHVEDLDDYIAAMSGKTINPPPAPPPMLPPPKTTVTEVPPDDTTDSDDSSDQPPVKSLAPPADSTDLETQSEEGMPTSGGTSQDMEADDTDVAEALVEDEEESDIGKMLMKYVKTLPQLAVTREEYRALLRAKR